MYLNITTTAGCRGKCAYCPQDLYWEGMHARPNYLTADEFRQVLPSLRDTLFEAFSFGGFSEPFDNPEIVDLLKLASEQPNVKAIQIYSNGEALTSEIVDEMASIPIELLDVSCHGFSPEVYRRTRNFIDPEKVRVNLLYLFKHRPNIRNLSVSLSGQFLKDVEFEELTELCRSNNARLHVRTLHSRAGLLKLGRQEHSPGAFRCAKFDFGKPVLIPGGDVALCCQDFGLQSILGNIHEQTFLEIMEHSTIRQHVLSVAAGNTVDPHLSCYKCEFCIPQNG